MTHEDSDSYRLKPARIASDASQLNAAIADAEQRRAWYAKYSRRADWGYRILALFQLVAAGLVPVLVAAGAPAWTTALSGGVAAALAGAQQVLQLGPDSMRMGATYVALDRELRLFRAQAGPYVESAERSYQLLAERVESLVASDVTTWVSRGHRDGISPRTGSSS